MEEMNADRSLEQSLKMAMWKSLLKSFSGGKDERQTRVDVSSK